MNFNNSVKNFLLSSSKKRLASIFLGLVLVLSIPITILLLGQQQDLRQRASSGEGGLDNKNIPKATGWKTYSDLYQAKQIKHFTDILELSINYDDKLTPPLSVEKIIKKNGYIPTTSLEDKDYSLEIIDKNKNILYKLPFSVQKEIPAGEPLPGQEHNNAVPVLFHSVKFIIVVPWIDKATEIKITDSAGAVILVNTLKNIESVNNQPSFHSLDSNEKIQTNKNNLLNYFYLVTQTSFAQTQTKKLDIVFIGDKYADLSIFHSDVNRLSANLLTFEPYKSRSSNVQFSYVDNTTDLGCAFQNNDPATRLILCDTSKATQIVNNAVVPWDKIFIIVNTPVYGGSGGDIGVGFNGAGGDYYSYAPNLFVHEFAHSFAILADEYVNNYNFSDQTNCYSGIPPNPNWQGVVDASSYFIGCDMSTWYRSSETSIMKDIGISYFNPISQKYINEKIDFYTTIPPTPTPANTPTPTNTPTSTPPATTATPTVTSTPTPSSTPVPTGQTTPTTTPVPSSTATPTVKPIETGIKFTVSLPGIVGTGNGGNPNPVHAFRSAEVKVFNDQNNEVKTATGILDFDSTTFTFKGAILIEGLIADSYIVKIRVENSLWKRIPGIVNITSGVVANTPAVELVTGDIPDRDNELNLADYNIIIDCINSRGNCNESLKRYADLNDDGKVDEVDLSILYAGFSNRKGD